MHDLPEHVQRNRMAWDDKAREYASAGARAWAQDSPTWGIWGVPEAQIGMFPAQKPARPTVAQLHRNGRLFPPNFLHDSWQDYLYWDTELDP